jgi:hypothetical protein
MNALEGASDPIFLSLLPSHHKVSSSKQLPMIMFFFISAPKTMEPTNHGLKLLKLQGKWKHFLYLIDFIRYFITVIER